MPRLKIIIATLALSLIATASAADDYGTETKIFACAAVGGGKKSCSPIPPGHPYTDLSHCDRDRAYMLRNTTADTYISGLPAQEAIVCLQRKVPLWTQP